MWRGTLSVGRFDHPEISGRDSPSGRQKESANSRIVGQPEAIQKRACGRSIHDLPEAQFVIQPEIRLNVGECVGDLSYFQKLSPQKPTTTEECALMKTGLGPLVCLRNSPVVFAV